MQQPLAAPPRRSRTRRAAVVVVGALTIVAAALTSVAAGAPPSQIDARSTLTPGNLTTGAVAAEAGNGVELLANRPKPDGWFDPNNPGSFAFPNSDLAFQGDHAFMGNFNGFLIYNIADPANPTLRTAVVCPGGQGEVSVYGNLLIMSAEETRARTDCGAPSAPTGSPLRFRGIRVFDISNLDAPVQVAAVQTCRGSHTHTLLKSPADADNLYVYVNGTGGVRPATELAGCKSLPSGTGVTTPHFDQELSQFRIEVVKIPLAAPQNAAVVGGPRLMGDPATGQINVLQNGPTQPLHPGGLPYSPSPSSDSCHDITTYPEIGLAAGACEGNGLLLDISNPANPVRIHSVADPNYSYWHGATFSNDGKTVVFTDEWGGGTTARCRPTDDLNWGADAIYDIVDSKLVFRSYFKLPVAQTLQENCVSHLPSLVPVPGRNIMTQAWYQGGVSVIDFTDSSNPKEIAWYDRGPIHSGGLVLGGLWSAYWYNGAVYGSEIARGFDSYKLTPTAELSENEIKAASEVEFDRLTPQHQPSFTWKPSFAVVRSHFDQAVRASTIDASTARFTEKLISGAEDYIARGKEGAAAGNLRALSRKLAHYPELAALNDAVDDLEAVFQP
jgi:hypothetical protein